MEYLAVGESQLSLSRIGLGGEQIGGTDWGTVDVEAAVQSVHAALEAGITLFDTADVYGLGVSEERLAAALGSRRKSVVLATKCGIAWNGRGSERAITSLDGRPSSVQAAAEASLERLNLDCIPLYQLHRADPKVPLEETLGAFVRLREQGKIREIGCCNLTASSLRVALSVAPIATVQVQLNFLERDVEHDILPMCRAVGVGVLCYGPLSQGLLAGRYTAGHVFPTSDRRHRLPLFQPNRLPDALARAQSLAEMSVRAGASPVQGAVRWVLDRPGVTAAITGVRNVRQLGEVVGAFDVSWCSDINQSAAASTPAGG
jgi:aryl-alcohol dehydrogenase-like predicted oxidoreductase